MVSWIFFADMRRPFTQHALARRMAPSEKVVVVGEAISVLRSHSIPSFQTRRRPLVGTPSGWDYRPLHWPQELPGLRGVLRRMNRHLLRQELNRLLPGTDRRIACYFEPTEWDLVGTLREALSIYYVTDDLTLTVWGDPFPDQVEEERRLLARVDAIIAVSEVLGQTMRSRVPGRRSIPIHVLPNGYDSGLFNPEKKSHEPAALRPIGRPRVLVAGYVSERIDWEGIIGAAQARPDWTWVFTGPAATGMPEKIERLAGELNLRALPGRFPRLVWLGELGREETPALIAHCEACAIPYRLNRFTLASSPLKAYEYLAMGGAVLSTRIPSLECLGDVVEWVEEGKGESYGAALDRLMAERNPPQVIEKRRGAVRNASWESRAQQFRNMVFGIESIENDKSTNRDDSSSEIEGGKKTCSVL